MSSTTHPNETARLACLRSLNILDTGPEESFDDLAIVASELVGCPFAVVSMIDHCRQWFKANVGLPMDEIPIEQTLCRYAIASEQSLIVPDATKDPRFAEHPFVVGEFHLRFYVGIPIMVEGLPIGTLCVGDTEPRELSSSKLTALLALARQTATLLQSRRAERQASIAEQRFSAFMSHAPAIAFLKDGDNRIQYVNERFETEFGFGPGESLMKRDCDWLPASVAEMSMARERLVIETGEVISTIDTVPGPDGVEREWSVQKFPVETEQGRWIGGMAIDVTELHEARRAAQAERDFSEAVLGNGGALVVVIDRDGQVIRFNVECERTTGWDSEAILGRSFWEALHPAEEREATQEWFYGLTHDDFPLATEREWMTRSGERRLIEWRSTALFDPQGRIDFVVSTGIDVTVRRAQERLLWRQRRELREANARLERLASTDELTQIANRFAFRERLALEMARSDRNGSPLSIVLLDVDRFKGFNDEYGHAAGDHTLTEVASVLIESVRGLDLVARYGGEEFIVLLPEMSATEALVAAERLRCAIESAEWPYRAVTASFGVATLRIGRSGEALVAEADRALYKSKAAGRNRVTHADSDAFPAAA